MRKLLMTILLILPLACAFAGQPVGNKMKQDPQMQEKAIDPGPDFPFAVGDTIVITKSQTHYLTGEKISAWVYNVMHTIKQMGSKRFPNGILIDGIMSWVGPEDLLLVNPVERQDSAAAAAVYRVMHADEIAAAEAAAAAAREQAVKDSIEAVRRAEEAAKAVPVTHEDSVRAGLISEPNEDEIINRLHEEALAQADSIAKYRHNYHKEKEHRFSIGVRGGVASLMQNTNDIMGNWRAGGDGMLDLQYAYYAGASETQSCNLGFITGVSVGYGNSGLRASVRDSFSLGDSIKYQIAAKNVNEQDGQIQVEIPLLFSLRHESGLFFNVGPRFMLPAFSHYKQTIDKTDEDATYIDAYFVNEGVHVVNKPVTGELTDEDCNQHDKRDFKKTTKFHVMLTSEIGYEWALRNGHNLGLGVYANYSLYNMYKNGNLTDEAIITVPNGPEANGAHVNVLTATDAYAQKQGFFDCGLKLVYHFGFPVK